MDITQTSFDDCNKMYKNEQYKGYIDNCSVYQDAASQYKLYTIYKDPYSALTDKSLAAYYVQQSAQKGYIPAYVEACKGYYYGNIFIKNYDNALFWCSKASDNNNDYGKN